MSISIKQGVALRALAAAAVLAAGCVHAGQIEVHLALRDGSGVADGVVAAYALGSTPPPGVPALAEVDQRGLSFVGQVTVVRTGTTVRFPNSDNVRHHVYSFSPAKTFELKLYSGNHASTVLLDKPGIITLGCNIHDWMLGYIYVLDTPYFAKTNDDGMAVVKDVPAGEYELRVWHNRLQAATEFLSEKISVGDDTLERSFVVALHPAEQSNKPPPGLEMGLDERAGIVR